MDIYRQVCDSLLFNQRLPFALESSISSFSLTEEDTSALKMDTAFGQGKTYVSPLHMAMIAGAILNLIVLLVGDLMYGTNISLVGAVLGSILAVAVGKVLEFLRFSVDYSRVENVQFEDDEYYYYVKAIPKITVAAPTKTVKHINVQRQASNNRSVVTERTATNGKKQYGERRTGGRSITIGNNSQPEAVEDFFEDIE